VSTPSRGNYNKIVLKRVPAIASEQKQKDLQEKNIEFEKMHEEVAGLMYREKRLGEHGKWWTKKWSEQKAHKLSTLVINCLPPAALREMIVQGLGDVADNIKMQWAKNFRQRAQDHQKKMRKQKMQELQVLEEECDKLKARKEKPMYQVAQVADLTEKGPAVENAKMDKCGTFWERMDKCGTFWNICNRGPLSLALI